MNEFVIREGLRYMGTSLRDDESVELCQKVYSFLSGIVRPKYLLRRVSCSVEEGGILVEGQRFVSRSLFFNLRSCNELLLLAATLGIEVDRQIHALSLFSVAEGNAAQAVASAMIEEYCNRILSEYDVEPLMQRSRFSPGYGDWDLSEQKKIFSLLDCFKIGLTLTSAGMMVPIKSVTAVIGIGPALNDDSKEKCDCCVMKQCAFRQ